MIDHIRIKNFAIIENTSVDFNEGLNIITGETGSGKSIVVEAISLALGSRADSSMIRTGCEKAVIQLLGRLDGEDLVLTREISSSGKNLCKLNGELVTLSQLNNVSHKLADIHGQYDNQSLLNPDYHITLVDSFKSEEIQPLKSEVRKYYSQFSKCKNDLQKLLSVERENVRKKDFLQYEFDEICKANLLPNEDGELKDKISVLQNGEKIYSAVECAYSMMEASSPSVMDGLAKSMREIQDISSYSRDLTELSSELDDIYYRLEDLCRNIVSIKDSVSFSPEELDQAILRLDTIDNLKKKYGSSIEEILKYKQTIEHQLNIIENFDAEKNKLQNLLSDAIEKLKIACSALTKKRKEVASQLEVEIENQLRDLNFSDARLKISVDSLSSPTPEGMDKVEILITTNKGSDLKPLAKVASGGEMSRIMLAFKTVLNNSDKIPTLIFDEIDSGISGITASIVGKKLRDISKDHQILCITHLPQIAACGDYNYRIKKETRNEDTFTIIEKLTEKEKVDEIARLLGGATVTKTTLESAEELIYNSKK